MIDDANSATAVCHTIEEETNLEGIDEVGKEKKPLFIGNSESPESYDGSSST